MEFSTERPCPQHGTSTDRRTGAVLRQRLDVGIQIVDAVSHLALDGPDSGRLESHLAGLLRRQEVLESWLVRLSGPNAPQQLHRVRRLEDGRWHHPPEHPVDHYWLPCVHCAATPVTETAPVLGVYVPAVAA